MYKKTKYISIFVLLLSFTLFLGSCDTGSAGTDSSTYRLNAQIAGMGTITDIDSGKVLTGNQDDMYSDQYLSYDTVRLDANGAVNNEFLFWADNSITNIYNSRRDITMSSNNDLMAVFGDTSKVILSGYIHESAQNKNVIGFWKVINEYPNIEIYVRDTRYSNENYRYFSDGYDVTDDPNENIIVEKDQVYESEFIAAIFRIEEPEENSDSLKLLFVYSDITVFQAIVLDGNHPDSNSLFIEAQEIYNENDNYSDGEPDNRDGFISFVRNVIYQNRNKDNIVGSTAWPYDGSNN